MNLSDYPALVTSLASLLGVLVLFIKLFWSGRATRKENAEAGKADAEAAEAWEGIAGRAASRIKELETIMEQQSLKLAALSKEMAVLKETIAERDVQIIKYQTTLTKWRAGIEVLVEQIKEKGDIPKWIPDND